MKLKEIRKSCGFTQKEVAEKLKVPRSTYNGYEQNISEPNIETIKNLADLFQVSTDYLLSHELYNKPAGEFYQLTDKQKGLIPLIKQLDDGLCDRVSGFIEGKLSKK